MVIGVLAVQGAFIEHEKVLDALGVSHFEILLADRLSNDESRYFGKTDYEIEIEFSDENAARKLLEDVRKLIGESASNSEVCTGKIRRFLEEFQRQK